VTNHVRPERRRSDPELRSGRSRNREQSRTLRTCFVAAFDVPQARWSRDPRSPCSRRSSAPPSSTLSVLPLLSQVLARPSSSPAIDDTGSLVVGVHTAPARFRRRAAIEAKSPKLPDFLSPDILLRPLVFLVRPLLSLFLPSPLLPPLSLSLLSLTPPSPVCSFFSFSRFSWRRGPSR